jgi:hypothetical protein
MDLEMRLQHYGVTCLSTAAVLVAGCSGPQSQGALPSALAHTAAATQGAIGPSTLPRDLLYVAGAIKVPGWVTVYPQYGSDQHRVGSITKDVDVPFGLAVDDHENLYVGNYHNSTVTVYARGREAPFETLTGAGKPVAIAVGRDGTVYVANQGILGPPHDASILEYPKGHTMPSKRIPIPYDSFPFGLALDSSNNLFATVNHYVAHSKTYQGAVYEFAPGSSKGKNIGLEGLANELTGMASDKSNDLLIVDDLKNSYYVLVFPPGKKNASRKIKINSGQAVVGIAINSENTEIWITTGWSGEAEGISYPGGSLLDTVAHPRGWAFGVAVSPASND